MSCSSMKGKESSRRIAGGDMMTNYPSPYSLSYIEQRCAHVELAYPREFVAIGRDTPCTRMVCGKDTRSAFTFPGKQATMDQYDLQDDKVIGSNDCHGGMLAAGMGAEEGGEQRLLYNPTGADVTNRSSVGCGSSSKTTNKKRRTKDTTLSEDAIPDEIINQALKLLEPRDLVRVTQVCKRWNDGIIYQSTWKQAGENIKREALRALEEAVNGNDKLTSKAMAVGLAKLGKKKVSPLQLHAPDLAIKTRSVPDATIKAEDVFILLELQAFNTTNAWCKNIGDSVDNFDFVVECGSFVTVDEPSKVPYRVPDDGHPARFHVSSHDDLLENLHLTASFWRQDTGQSFSVCADELVDKVCDDESIWFDCGNLYNLLEPLVCVSLPKLDDDGVYCVSSVSVNLLFSKDEVSQNEFLLFLEALDWK